MSDNRPGGSKPLDFDAADLADAILADPKIADPKNAARPPAPPPEPHFLGPILLMLAGLAVTLAIGLALQFNTDRAQQELPRCDALYASVSEDCCADDWVENWAPCRLVCEPQPDQDRDPDPDRDGGLFDAEEHFADDDRRIWPDC